MLLRKYNRNSCFLRSFWADSLTSSWPHLIILQRVFFLLGLMYLWEQLAVGFFFVSLKFPRNCFAVCGYNWLFHSLKLMHSQPNNAKNLTHTSSLGTWVMMNNNFSFQKCVLVLSFLKRKNMTFPCYGAGKIWAHCMTFSPKSRCSPLYLYGIRNLSTLFMIRLHVTWTGFLESPQH